MKKGYHSTQDKVYGKIARSEFYGFVLGYAVGTILRGIFKLDSNTVPQIKAGIGLLIGIWYDRKYFMVKDGEDEAENVGEAAGAETAGALSSDQEDHAGAKTVEALSPVEEDHAGTEEIASGSIQANLKKMFENIEEDEEDESAATVIEEPQG